LADTPIRRLAVLAASIVIAVTLVLQGLASFTLTPGPIEDPPFMWPFLDYPMYSRPWYAGDPIERRVVIGILGDSSEVLIEPEDMGVTFWQFNNFLNPAIVRGNPAQADPYRSVYEARSGQRLLGFRLEDHPLIITHDGLVDGSPTVLGTLSFRSD